MECHCFKCGAFGGCLELHVVVHEGACVWVGDGVVGCLGRGAVVDLLEDDVHDVGVFAVTQLLDCCEVDIFER